MVEIAFYAILAKIRGQFTMSDTATTGIRPALIGSTIGLSVGLLFGGIRSDEASGVVTKQTPTVIQTSSVTVGGYTGQVTAISRTGDGDEIKQVFRSGSVSVFEGDRLIFEKQIDP